MKYLKRLLVLLPLFIVTACNKLDIAPVNILKDKDVFSTDAGVGAYLIPIYAELPIEDFRYNFNDGFNAFPPFPALGLFTAEFLQIDYVFRGSIEHGSFGYWPYDKIRKINYLLETLPKNSSNFSEAQANAYLGEAHFLRAYFYFDLVKRYGGVPIAKTPQDPFNSSQDELRIPRSSEEDVYKFIEEDLNQAIQLMPDVSADDATTGRANRNVALALKSRAMLYAGSIAKYGSMQLSGLLGIPSGQAQSYFQKSYDAAVMLEGKYSLYRVNADKYQNYVNLFLDRNSPENIFIKDYKYPDKTHSWDALNAPKQFVSGYGSFINPTLDYVELYGELKVNDDNGFPIRFNDRMDLFKNAEPRLRASVIFPGDKFRNEVIDVQRGIYPSYKNGDEAANSTALKTAGSIDVLYNGKRVVGLSGMGIGGSTGTGFYVRKYQNSDLPQGDLSLWRSDQAWIDIRYAEVLLNKAEAGVELGTSETEKKALDAMNDIRDRAGAPVLMPAQLNVNSVRNERRKELAFENHSWWDNRRWRVADKEFNNRIYKVLFPYYVFDENKYIFKKDDELTKSRFTFQVKFYYEPIPGDQINRNPLLVQNPLY
ncbi:RagB/SusD family nutrient uptake outer membrane protein [Mucilaginibacter pedocola]|uniref:Carbohydrate-binding protein SusD n=1 Tax=Mucilaginibacter pedocola TaxID=1792845 RepID=A0A1S9PB18_9SPHI|nr:RagB/SusD family nutrient uptake outer membrane protein [Mucilaginibacter pedocola]OOQ57798.1 hypothetical protein BC343_13525 [Mucilaginibacter pedocola]